MKALTVRQPYATWIVKGIKTVEVRSRAIAHRGPLAIHAATTPAPGFEWEPGSELEFPRGVVIGTVKLVECRPLAMCDVDGAILPADWKAWECEGLFAWVLEAPELVNPFPAKGKLNLWEVDLP